LPGRRTILVQGRPTATNNVHGERRGEYSSSRAVTVWGSRSAHLTEDIRALRWGKKIAPGAATCRTHKREKKRKSHFVRYVKKNCLSSWINHPRGKFGNLETGAEHMRQSQKGRFGGTVSGTKKKGKQKWGLPGGKIRKGKLTS